MTSIANKIDFEKGATDSLGQKQLKNGFNAKLSMEFRGIMRSKGLFDDAFFHNLAKRECVLFSFSTTPLSDSFWLLATAASPEMPKSWRSAEIPGPIPIFVQLSGTKIRDEKSFVSPRQKRSTLGHIYVAAAQWRIGKPLRQSFLCPPTTDFVDVGQTSLGPGAWRKESPGILLLPLFDPAQQEAGLCMENNLFDLSHAELEAAIEDNLGIACVIRKISSPSDQTKSPAL